MSGKLTLDTDAGGSVTLTVDDTETGDINYPLDSAGIESGSNADGNWTKFPDGTLITTINATTSAGAQGVTLDYVWSYPSQFISIPSISTCVSTNSPQNYESSAQISENTATIYVYNGGGSTTDRDIFVQAIGRWK